MSVKEIFALIILAGLMVVLAVLLRRLFYGEGDKKDDEPARLLVEVNDLCVLGDGKNPFQQCRVRVVGIAQGYVGYRYVRDWDGQMMGPIQSMREPNFFETYTVEVKHG